MRAAISENAIMGEEHHPSGHYQGDVEHEEKETNGVRHANTQTYQPGPYAIPFSIILASVIISGAILFANGMALGPSKKATAQAGDSVAVAGDSKSLEANAPVLGDPEAPVAIVEFADYQCPFCGRFFSATARSLIDTYVKTGKAKFIYRDFAFLGEESSWAAQAARCAGDQGKYWQYHDYLFTHQSGENEGAFSKANLKGFAREVGLNGGAFDACLDSGKHEQEVKNDTELGRKFGVTGTPTTFINGKAVQGAQPVSAFEPIIIEALGAK